MEGDAVSSRWDDTLPRHSELDNDGDGYNNAMLTQMIIPTYYCPSMTPPTAPLTDNRGPSSYLFSAGTPDVTLFHYATMLGEVEPLFDGAIVPIKTMDSASPNLKVTKLATITDGTSHTYLAGETDFKPYGNPSTFYGGVWAYGYMGYTWGTTFLPFNNHRNLPENSVYGAFRSEHPGGANFAMVDGSVRFVSEKIDPLTHAATATRAGRELLSEGKMVLPLVPEEEEEEETDGETDGTTDGV